MENHINTQKRTKKSKNMDINGKNDTYIQRESKWKTTLRQYNKNGIKESETTTYGNAINIKRHQHGENTKG